MRVIGRRSFYVHESARRDRWRGHDWEGHHLIAEIESVHWIRSGSSADRIFTNMESIGLKSSLTSITFFLSSQQSVAASDGVIGFRLLDRAKVAVYRIYCAERQRDPEHDGNRCRNDKFYGDHFVGHRGSSL